jgi:hypothetical protein
MCSKLCSSNALGLFQAALQEVPHVLERNTFDGTLPCPLHWIPHETGGRSESIPTCVTPCLTGRFSWYACSALLVGWLNLVLVCVVFPALSVHCCVGSVALLCVKVCVMFPALSVHSCVGYVLKFVSCFLLCPCTVVLVPLHCYVSKFYCRMVCC